MARRTSKERDYPTSDGKISVSGPFSGSPEQWVNTAGNLTASVNWQRLLGFDLNIDPLDDGFMTGIITVIKTRMGFEVMDNTALEQTAQKLLQKIRTTLRTNLIYGRDHVIEFMVDSLALQAMLVQTSRDLGLRNVFEARFPNVWEALARVPLAYTSQSVVRETDLKLYLQDDDYAQSITQLRTLVSEVATIPIISSAHSLLAWLCGSVFRAGDYTSSQFYVNDFHEITSPTFGTVTTSQVSLPDLRRFARMLNEKYIVLMADIIKAMPNTKRIWVADEIFTKPAIKVSELFQNVMVNAYPDNPFNGNFVRIDAVSQEPVTPEQLGVMTLLTSAVRDDATMQLDTSFVYPIDQYAIINSLVTPVPDLEHVNTMLSRQTMIDGGQVTQDLITTTDQLLLDKWYAILVAPLPVKNQLQLTYAGGATSVTSNWASRTQSSVIPVPVGSIAQTWPSITPGTTGLTNLYWRPETYRVRRVCMQRGVVTQLFGPAEQLSETTWTSANQAFSVFMPLGTQMSTGRFLGVYMNFGNPAVLQARRFGSNVGATTGIELDLGNITSRLRQWDSAIFGSLDPTALPSLPQIQDPGLNALVNALYGDGFLAIVPTTMMTEIGDWRVVGGSVNGGMQVPIRVEGNSPLLRGGVDGAGQTNFFIGYPTSVSAGGDTAQRTNFAIENSGPLSLDDLSDFSFPLEFMGTWRERAGFGLRIQAPSSTTAVSMYTLVQSNDLSHWARSQVDFHLPFALTESVTVNQSITDLTTLTETESKVLIKEVYNPAWISGRDLSAIAYAVQRSLFGWADVDIPSSVTPAFGPPKNRKPDVLGEK